MSQLEQIYHGDPEPPHHTRWEDSKGTVHDYSKRDGRWGQPGTHYFTIWSQIPERYFPMTRIEDKQESRSELTLRAKIALIRQCANRVEGGPGYGDFYRGQDAAAESLRDWADDLEGQL